jgi:hypothetical protein
MIRYHNCGYINPTLLRIGPELSSMNFETDAKSFIMGPLLQVDGLAEGRQSSKVTRVRTPAVTSGLIALQTPN